MSYTWLPPLLNEIADVAGLSAALALAEVRGGSRISIPRKLPHGHWLTQTIGEEAALKLCEHFASTGSAQMDLPVGPTSAMNGIRRRCDQMLREGISPDEIACKLKMHRTTVFRRKANLVDETPQRDLFNPDV